MRTVCIPKMDGTVSNWEIHDLQLMGTVDEKEIVNLGKDKAKEVLVERMAKNLAEVVIREGYYRLDEEYNVHHGQEVLGMRVKIMKEQE